MTSSRSRGVWIRRLLRLILGLVCVEYLVATVGVQISRTPVRTDFASYYLAGTLARQGIDPYDAPALAAAGRDLGFTFDQYPFLYPPPFALLMAPLSLLPFEAARALWMLASTAALFTALALIWRLVDRVAGQRPATGVGISWILGVPFVVMVLNGTAVHNDLRSGSVGAFLLLVLVLFVRACSLQQACAAGVWLTVATVLKLSPILLLPWLAWRMGRRAVFATVVSATAALLPAWFVWGPTILWKWAHEALWPAASLSRAWPHNVSLQAFVRRPFESLGDGATTLAAVAAGLLEILVVFLSVRALPQRDHPVTRPLESGVLLLALLLVMRITWVHTLTAMVFVWPLLLCAATDTASAVRGDDRRLVGLLCVGFFLATAHLPVLWGERWLGWPWLLAPGLHTVGLLILWGVGLVLLRRGAQPPGRTGVRLA